MKKVADHLLWRDLRREVALPKHSHDCFATERTSAGGSVRLPIRKDAPEQIMRKVGEVACNTSAEEIRAELKPAWSDVIGDENLAC